jgi:hypothetical protein
LSQFTEFFDIKFKIANVSKNLLNNAFKTSKYGTNDKKNKHKSCKKTSSDNTKNYTNNHTFSEIFEKFHNFY